MKFPRKFLAVIGAVALVSLGSAAYAGPQWTVSVGGSSTGSPATFSAATVGTNPDIVFTVPSAGLTLTCDDGTANGTIIPGPTVQKAGEITSTMFNGCIGPFGVPLDVTQTCDWDLDITADNVGGVTPHSVSSVCAHVENPDGLCEFDVTGSVPAAFDEGNQQLAVSGGGLTVSNVTCLVPIPEGAGATFDGTYQLSNIPTVTIAN